MMSGADQKRFVFYTKGVDFHTITDVKSKKQRYFVKGHIDTEDVDLVNDIVTKGCMTDVQKQLNARTIKLDLDHETLRKGSGESDFDVKLNMTKIPLGKAINDTLDSKGNLVEFELNPNWKKFDSKGNIVMTFKETWENIKSKFYDAFSIAYIPVKTTYKSMKEGNIRMLDKINLINVALTGNAINPAATITNVMAKSLEWLKENEVSNMEQKGYEKDGAHAHTSESPLGEHNHPEIENRIQSEYNYLSDRIERLSDRLYKFENVDPESSTMLKGKNKTKEGDNMTDEKKPADVVKPAEQGTEKKPDASTDTTSKEAPADGEKPAAEGKSIDAKAFGELKSTVDKLTEGIDKINKVLEKALPAGYGTVNKSEQTNNVADTKSQITGTLDLI